MELVIAQSANNLSSLKGLLSVSVDILVLSQSVMVALDVRGIKYKTVEDFYSADQYCLDTSIYHKKAENLLSELDEICEDVANFPYSYSGNGIYLLTWFDDLFYLEQLIQVMQKKYKKIYLHATDEPKQLLNNQLCFSRLNSYRINGTISFPSERSVERMMQLIYNSIDLHFVQDAPCVKSKIPFTVNAKHFLNRLQGLIDRKFTLKKHRRCERTQLKSENVYLIQDGYDVPYLKTYLPKLKYLNPVTQLRQDTETEQPLDVSSLSTKEVLDPFIKDYFPFLGSYIHLFIMSYLSEIVGRIAFFKKQFEYSIQKDSPSFLLLSIGTRDVFDLVCCHVANHRHVPVIIFQHGGTAMFQYSSYQKYLEYNERILKTLVVQSGKELSKVQNKTTRPLLAGSIQQFEKNQTLNTEAAVKEILFCLGPDVDSSFRHLLNFYSINKKHRQSINIIGAIENASLPVDVKLHPTGEKNSYSCYNGIITNNQYNHANVLYGSFAETILSNYKLIVIDFLPSAIIKHIFSLKRPIIFCDEDFDKMRVSAEILSDLCKRCYIAKSVNELDVLLQRYKSGDLPSKWSEDFIDKFIYPVGGGNPGRKVAKYICNTALSNKYIG